jgi:hypothetical protein
VLNDGLRPICHTPSKLYATWGDPEPLRKEVARRAVNEAGFLISKGVNIRDMPIMRIYEKKKKPAT